MDALVNFIVHYHAYAPWIIFTLLILAGLNIPISIDVVVILGAILAANVIPEQTITLFLCIFFGCHLSAWGSYWLGRLAGEKLLKLRWFQKIMPQARFAKVAKFHNNRRFTTVLVCRFIPFGVRNCFFMSAGMSKSSFPKVCLTRLFCLLYLRITDVLLVLFSGEKF